MKKYENKIYAHECPIAEKTSYLAHEKMNDNHISKTII
jgi:hypothetical protein